MRSERQEAYEPSLLQGAVRGLRRGPFQPGVQVRPRARPHSARGGRVARQSGSNIFDIPIKTSLTFLFFLVSDHVLLRPLQALLCHRQQKGAQVLKKMRLNIFTFPQRKTSPAAIILIQYRRRNHLGAKDDFRRTDAAPNNSIICSRQIRALKILARETLLLELKGFLVLQLNRGIRMKYFHMKERKGLESFYLLLHVGGRNGFGRCV